ncbi:phosphatase PAP2 family protein [Streptomyces sp. TRM49041]|uniref:phosphatase PAP2 family protein n=1 Tax=Streptomyces sp. TRM49041 TaxID=2603216 RepID=UPI0011EC34E8|nr:phosphatase PAP2 family protein [Streptomyces sp. TRM49041]
MPSPTYTPVTPVPLARAVVGAVGSGAAAVALTLLVVVEWGPLIAFDRTVAEELHASAVRRPVLTRGTRVLSDWVWDPWTLRALLAVAAIALWRRGERGLVWLSAVAGVVAAVVVQGLKAVAGRARPWWPDPVDSADFGAFPSGHAMTAAVVCGLLWWLAARVAHRNVVRLVAWAGAVSVLGVGLTRLYLGVHWASDVVGGWLLGGCVVAAAVVAYERRRTAVEGALAR